MLLNNVFGRVCIKVRSGVARSCGNELGVGVGVDQATSTPTPDGLLQFARLGLTPKKSVKFSGMSPFSNIPSQNWRYS